MHKRIALKRILKFTLNQLLRVSVQSPSSGSVLFEQQGPNNTVYAATPPN